MNNIQLVIETPSAGQHNHRFIVATSCSYSESYISNIINAANSNLEGDNYIAINYEIVQSSSGRTGKEVLVLVGVDVKQLSDPERDKIQQQLATLDVATLITETIDWNKDGKEILILRPELGEWEKHFSSLPKFSNPKKFKFVSSVIIIFVVISISNSSHYNKLEPPKPPPVTNYYEQFLTRLEEDFDWKWKSEKTVTDCHIPDLSSNLSPMSPAECELRQLVNDSEIEEALNDLHNAKDKLSISLMFIPDYEISHLYLKKDLTNFPDNVSFDQIDRTRKILRDTFATLKKVVKTKYLEDKCRLDSSQYPMLFFACKIVSKSHKAQNILVREQENYENLPFFSKDDAHKAKILKEIADQAKDNKFIEVKKDASVLAAFCLPTQIQEQIPFYFAYEIKKIGDDDFEKMTTAVIEYIKSLNLQCNKQ